MGHLDHCSQSSAENRWHHPLPSRIWYVGSGVILGWYKGPIFEILKWWQTRKMTDFQLVDSIPSARRDRVKKDQTCNLHMRYPHLSFFFHIHQRIHGWHINQSTWNIKFCLSFTFSLSSLSSMISAIAMILNIKLLIRTQGTWIWIWI